MTTGMRSSRTAGPPPGSGADPLGEVRGTLQSGNAARFRDVHVNIAHDGLCGEVDFEYRPGRRPIRSGFRRLVVELAH
jgi:hypothetical protein